MSNYSFYVIDTETTGLSLEHDIVELSLIRLSDEQQKTWFLKPLNFDSIEVAALRINGHKIEDLRGETKEGREKYQEPSKVIIEVENWLGEDNLPSEARFLVGHNVNFDKNMMEQLWKKCGASDSFPFGRRILDTMIVELFLDYCKNEFAEGYSLNNLSKKYGVKNEKAHSAVADTKCAMEIFKKQVEFFKGFLKT